MKRSTLVWLCVACETQPARAYGGTTTTGTRTLGAVALVVFAVAMGGLAYVGLGLGHGGAAPSTTTTTARLPASVAGRYVVESWRPMRRPSAQVEAQLAATRGRALTLAPDAMAHEIAWLDPRLSCEHPTYATEQARATADSPVVARSAFALGIETERPYVEWLGVECDGGRATFERLAGRRLAAQFRGYLVFLAPAPR